MLYLSTFKYIIITKAIDFNCRQSLKLYYIFRTIEAIFLVYGILTSTL